MIRNLQLRSFFWRYLRTLHNILKIPIPTLRVLLFPFIEIPHSSVGRVVTASDVVNYIISIFPSRWPMSIPLFTQRLITTLALVVNAWVLFDIASDLANNNELLGGDPKCQSTTFDYIIVGGGTAGIVVATRIANASSNVRVLLLEAGGEPSILNDVPCFDFYLMNQPANTWRFESLPQENACFNADGQKSVTTSGRMLGGSTSTNFMLYTRGNKEDFNRWAVDAMDDQWNYENVLEFFKRSEDYNGAFTNENTSAVYHGKGGLLHVATHKYLPPGTDDFLAAGVEKGYSIGDYNGDEQEVFSKMDMTNQDGWRESAYRAFYQDTGKPPNLCIKKYAHVTKIKFDPGKGNGKIRATGVIYSRQDHVITVNALKEVIVSAGTFGSPKLLLSSGVGPSEELRGLGIPEIVDAPVGENLQDHVYALVGPFLKGPSLPSPATRNREFSLAKAAYFLMNEDGEVTTPVGLAGHAFFQSPVAQPAYPDLQAIQFSISLNPATTHVLHGILGTKDSVLQEWLQPYSVKNFDTRFVVVVLGRPKSVGKVALASTDPNHNLIIHPNYLSHPDDREALLFGFKKVVDLFENTTILNTQLYEKPVPGCEQEEFKSDDYFRCVIKHMSGSFYGHVGTCALGEVVDSRLRVKGIDGLRVIDASVIPRAPNGNTQAATIMIGEKGAEFIISDMFDNNELGDGGAVVIEIP